jgi:PKD domain-containing protein/ASPM-SPD-2-Hydin domain-containing protein
MRWTKALALILVLATVVVADAGGKTKLLRNNLLSVRTPASKQPASAHPSVNVIVFFGILSDGTPVDPSTFRARIRHEDVTDRFTPTLDAKGKQNGMRGTLDHSMVRLCHRPCNLLRLTVQAKKVKGARGSRARDTDRVRFGAEEHADQPPVAVPGADTDIIVPGIPVSFTGSVGSFDPDLDALTYSWDFGDGTMSTDPNPTHTYEALSNDVTVTLTVSDGQLDSAPATVSLLAVPPLDPGRTPGALHVDAATTLEFGGVAVGATATKTITFSNTDTTPTSQVKLRLASANAVFAFSETNVSLDPGQSHDVTLTFAPVAADHQSARLGVVANDTNRQSASFLAHGFGGAAPDNGPTMCADPVFYTDIVPGLLGLSTYGFMPDGHRFLSDDGLHTCVVPGNGAGTGDFCVVDADCQSNGGTCATTSTCPSGANAGQSCTVPSDCPGSFCPSYTTFDPVEFCSDGQSIYLLSDDGTYTDPNPNDATERSETIMRMDLAADGSVTNKQILYRPTTETGHIACDGFPASQGGQVYIPEYHELPDSLTCFRSDLEELVHINKSNGAAAIVPGFGRIDAAEGLGPCDDLDTVDELVVTRDGSHTFATFDGGSTANSGGLWQIRPTSLWFSPDIVDTFQAHPDNSVMWAAATDSGSTGLVNLYRITPDQVVHGPLPFASLQPCASFPVPNNGGRTFVISFAADRDAIGSQSATGLVSFVASAQGLSSTVSQTLLTRGTVAFTAPPNSTDCSVLGLVNLEGLELGF